MVTGLPDSVAMVTIKLSKYCHGYQGNIDKVTKAVFPWLPSKCCHSYQCNIAMVTKAMLPWSSSKCCHGYQATVAMVTKPHCSGCYVTMALIWNVAGCCWDWQGAAQLFVSHLSFQRMLVLSLSSFLSLGKTPAVLHNLNKYWPPTLGRVQTIVRITMWDQS